MELALNSSAFDLQSRDINATGLKQSFSVITYLLILDLSRLGKEFWLIVSVNVERLF